MRHNSNKLRPSSGRKAPSSKPAWNDNLTDLSRYQLSNVELLQRKVSCSSKNRLKAREDVAKAQQELKEGKLPIVYMDAITHKLKKENLREVYRQKAKAIVYPVTTTGRCVSTCRNYTAPFAFEKNTDKTLQEAEGQEPEMKAGLHMSKRVADVFFTSINERKLPARDDPVLELEENNNVWSKEEEDINEIKKSESRPEPEKNYLDCDENIKKLNMLNEEIVTRNSEIDDYMAGLNAALGMTPKTQSANRVEFVSEPEMPREYAGNAHRTAVKEEIDENELDRISRLIAETHKDIDRMNISGTAETAAVPMPMKTPPVAMKACGDDMQKYENSFFHTRGNKENVTMNCSGLSVNVATAKMINGAGTGIISRRISNKANISLAAATGPRQLIVASEYYKTTAI